MWHRTLLALAVVSASAPLSGQDIRVQVARQQPPYYVGEPVLIQFSVEGFDAQPEPTCALDTPNGQPLAGLRGQMAGANASVFSQTFQQNGRLFRSQSVTYEIQYLVTADRPGDFMVGPFLIKQGNKETNVQPVSMSFQDVPLDPDMNVRLILPERPVYPDQRVPVTIQWWYANDLENVLKLNIYSPLFDQFRFAPDELPSRQSTQLPIETKDGRLALAASASRETRDGRQFIVVSATRTLIPDRVGQFPLAPITATVHKATAWERSRSLFDDLDEFGFGGSLFRDLMDERRRPARTELARAVGESRELLVQPFPVQGRPESFAGAVGQGFSLDVAADRTVVRVGDPIALRITLRGDGNIATASLPPLSADSGMDPDRFRLPEGDVPGTLTDGTKEFRVSVRVADEGVAEIPALAYSWFNPTSETYQTSYSKPIALRVMPAQVVSASDVVSSNNDGSGRLPASATGDASSGETDGRAVAMAAPNRTGLSFSGADLAIEQDLGAVLRSRRTLQNTKITQVVIYAAGFLAVVVALVDRRRRAVDPALTARRKTVHRQKARIARAASLPKRAAAEEIAAAVRVLIAEVPDIARDAAQSVVGECEAIAYAPEPPDDARLEEGLIERARQVAEV